MKAERRHELKQNTLVRGVQHLPEVWKAYGSRIALGLILVLLAIVLVRLWASSKADSKRRLSEDLTAARSALEDLRGSQETPPRARLSPTGEPLPYPQDRIAEKRKDVAAKVDAAVAAVLKDSTDPAQQAEAKVLRADLNYHFGLLASIGELPDAATRPSLAVGVTPAEAFDRAAANYSEVIAQAASLPAWVVSSAKLGLAAIAEDRHDLAKARELYEAVMAQGDEEAKGIAQAKVKGLTAAGRDLLVGPPRTLAVPTAAATKPATSTAPATGTAPASGTPASGSVPTTTSTAPATVATTSPASIPAPATQGATPPATSPATAAATQPATAK